MLDKGIDIKEWIPYWPPVRSRGRRRTPNSSDFRDEYDCYTKRSDNRRLRPDAREEWADEQSLCFGIQSVIILKKFKSKQLILGLRTKIHSFRSGGIVYVIWDAIVTIDLAIILIDKHIDG